MLQAFNDRIRNSPWLGYAIVTAISIPFALWGIQAYVSGPDASVAAEVNGSEITAAALDQRVSQQRRTLRERLGELPPGFSDSLLRQQALESLITRELLRQAAADANLRVDDARLARRIQQQSMFQSDGRFDRQRYERTLAQAGLSPTQYEARIRQQYRVEQLRDGIGETGFALADESRRIARLQAQERRVSLIRRTRAAVEAQVEVDEEALRSYYREHEDAFRTPARVRVAYLELDLEALAEQIEVSEEEVRSEFRANEERYRGQEARAAAHILIEVPGDAAEEAVREARAEAERLRERITGGAGFASLAREHSDDTGSASQGGELGYIARGTMGEAFEQALFSLEEPGAVSEPVRTDYGFHLVKLLDVREAQGRSFAEARAEIERELRTRRAERLFYDRVEVLRNTTYENPGTLEPAADTTGLEIRRSDWFTRAEGEGIASAEAVREAAFSEEVLGERRNSDLIELGQRRVAVVRVTEHRPPEARPFEEVRDTVVERVRAQRVDERLRAWSEEVVAGLRDGRDPAAFTDDGSELRELGWITEADGDVAGPVRRAAFELPPPRDGGAGYRAVALGEGDRGVVIVSGFRLPEVGEEQVRTARQRLQEALTSGELQAWVAALREQADIERNQRVLER